MKTFLAILVATFLMACNSPLATNNSDGNQVVGPPGPQGEKGDTGVPGLDGKDGNDGSDGSSCTINEFMEVISIVCSDGTSVSYDKPDPSGEYQMVEIGKNIVPAVGGPYDVALVARDRSAVASYFRVGTRTGFAIRYHAGDPEALFQTVFTVKPINYVAYTVGGKAVLCWDNTNREATKANIDTICDRANDLLYPQVSCSCQ